MQPDRLLAGLAVYSTRALAPAVPAVAQQVSFTVTGARNNTGQGAAPASR